MCKKHSAEWCERVSYYELVDEIVNSITNETAALLLLDQLTKMELM